MKHTEQEKRAAVTSILTKMEVTAEPKYRDLLIHFKLTENHDSILGCRMGPIHKAAKALIKLLTYEDVMEWLYPYAEGLFEYKLLFSEVAAKVVPEEAFEEHIQVLYSLTDGWGTTDSFAGDLFTIAQRGGLDLVLEAQELYRTAEHPFARRLTLITMRKPMMKGLVTIEETLDRILPLQHDEHYYVQIGLAWVLTDCYTHFPKETERRVLKELTAPEVKKLFLRKLTDSYKVKGNISAPLRSHLKPSTKG